MVSPNALKVLLPTSSAKTSSPQTVSVSISPDLEYYVNGNPVEVSGLELMIKTNIGDAEKPGIVLHCDQSVPLEHAVMVMDIANKNQYDLVLATKPN